jgi:hypothetical protein
VSQTKDQTTEVVPDAPEAPYNIGKTQNYPININQFLEKNAGDPAIKV